jgi:glutamyl-tRNA synthetase
MTTIRTRFAPSPTGFLHVGGLRTALYNYLFAKKNNGQFILRVEDTDQSRKVEGAIENLIETLNWAGITFDEGPGTNGQSGPYIQSKRLDLYQKYAKQLIEKGHAYYCFCSQERLEQIRKHQTEAKLPTGYDRHCRNIDPKDAQERVDLGQQYVIRMKLPISGEMRFNDLIRGVVSIGYKNLDDQVILKSDGFPTYHLAVVVDDHHMKISHIIRGEEWLPSTPKHILLYQYFDWEVPQLAHLPLLLNPDRSKLSKRQGDVAVEDYRAKGYLKEALVNFVAFLGWNPGDTREIFSLQELMNEFSLERVGKSGAIFNVEKLDWMNEQHIRIKTDDQIFKLLKPVIENQKIRGFSDDYFKKVISIMKDRVTLIEDFISGCPFFYKDPQTFDQKSKTKNWGPQTAEWLKILSKQFESLSSFNAPSTEQALRTVAQDLEVGAGKLIHPLRLALTGVPVGPSLFHIVELLGKEASLRRISYAVKTLG